MGGLVRRAGRLGPFALLIVAGCKVNGPRGPAFTVDKTYAPQPIELWRTEVLRPGPTRQGPRAEHDVTTAIAALAQAMAESERRDARIVTAGAPTRQLRILAAETAERAGAHLEAISTLATARQLDLMAPAVQADPLLVTQQDIAIRNSTTLAALSGKQLAATYLSAAPQRLSLLASLADMGMRASPDLDARNVFRLIGHDARALARRAVAAADGLGEP